MQSREKPSWERAGGGGGEISVSFLLQCNTTCSFLERSLENTQPHPKSWCWEPSEFLELLWCWKGWCPTGSQRALLSWSVCSSFPGPSRSFSDHGPDPPHRDRPSRATSCPDHRHRVRTKEAEEKENLLYLPTEDQYVWANKPRVLWQSMI